MNIVQLIVDQLLSAGWGKLSGLLGVREEKVEAAVGAAVPALLSGLSHLASTGDGAQKLTSALRKFDASSLTNLANMISGNPDAVAEQGTSMLNSLFSGNVLSALLGSVGRFVGLGDSAVNNLFGYITPLVLGAVAKHFIGKPINAQGLTDFFASQKSHITNALPTGLSLADAPRTTAGSPAARPGTETRRAEYEEAGTAARPAYETGRRDYPSPPEPVSSPWKWLLPLLVLAALPLLWYLSRPRSTPAPEVATPRPAPQVAEPRVATPQVAEPRPAAPEDAKPRELVPDLATVTRDVTSDFSWLTDTLNSVKDPASAEAALPRLTELSHKFEGMKTLVNRLPNSARTTVTELIQSNMSKIRDQFARVLMIPGVTDKLRPALEGLGTQVASLAGLPANQYALPSVEVTQLGSQLSELVSSLTETITGIHDKGSAEAALPKLRQLNERLDAIKVAWEKMPETGKSAIRSTLRTAMPSVKTHVNDVMRLAGVSATVRQVIDPIMTKLDQLAS
jgi:hypothetical protein